MAWRTWNTRRFQNVSHWSQSLGWTKGVSPPWLPASSVLHSVRAHHFSDSSAPPLPGAQYVVCQARGVGTHQSISLISIKYNLASQLFQTLPLQDPLWGSHPKPDLEETHGIDPRSPWTSTHFFLGSSSAKASSTQATKPKAGFVGQSALNN